MIHLRQSGGQKAALIGGLIGLASALGLGGLRFINSEPPKWRAEIFGTLVFASIYATPYIVAILLSRVRDSGTRGALLLPLALLSLVAGFSAFSGVTIVLLPATIMLFIGATQSLRTAGRTLLRTLGVFCSGLIGVAAIAFSFFALFVLGEDEPRCWALKITGSGVEQWQPIEPQGGPNTTIMYYGDPQTRRTLCTSDVITNQEAGVAIGMLAVGIVVLAGVVRFSPQPRPSR